MNQQQLDNQKVIKALEIVLEWMDVERECICNLLFKVYKYKGLITVDTFKVTRRYLDDNLPEREYKDDSEEAIWYSWHPEDIEARKQWLTEQINYLKNNHND